MRKNYTSHLAHSVFDFFSFSVPSPKMIHAKQNEMRSPFKMSLVIKSMLGIK